MKIDQLEQLAREYVAENRLSLHEKLLLSHFVAQLKQQLAATVTDGKRSWELLKGG